MADKLTTFTSLSLYFTACFVKIWSMPTSTLTAILSIDKKVTWRTQRFSKRGSPKVMSAMQVAGCARVLPELSTLDNWNRSSQARRKKNSIAIIGSGMVNSASLMVNPSAAKRWASLPTHVQAILSWDDTSSSLQESLQARPFQSTLRPPSKLWV